MSRKQGTIYAIQTAPGRVKIGFTTNLDQRVRTILGHAGEAEVLHFVEGTHEEERQLHWYCAEQRITNEFFRNEGPVAEFASGRLSVAEVVSRHRSHYNRLEARERWRKRKERRCAMMSEKAARDAVRSDLVLSSPEFEEKLQALKAASAAERERNRVVCELLRSEIDKATPGDDKARLIHWLAEMEKGRYVFDQYDDGGFVPRGKVCLFGRLVRGPIIGTSTHGTRMVNFGLREESGADFDVVAFRGIGEGCATHLVEGSSVIVSGRAIMSGANMEVVADHVSFRGPDTADAT